MALVWYNKFRITFLPSTAYLSQVGLICILQPLRSDGITTRVRSGFGKEAL